MPAGRRLVVPLHVQLASLGLGLGTMSLGGIYLLTPPQRPSGLDTSVVAILEPTLGTAMAAVGAWAMLAAMLQASRASAHLVAAVAHAVYFLACMASFLLTTPVRPTVVAVLAFLAFVAHGGACLAYFQRGWR